MDEHIQNARRYFVTNPSEFAKFAQDVRREISKGPKQKLLTNISLTPEGKAYLRDLGIDADDDDSFRANTNFIDLLERTTTTKGRILRSTYGTACIQEIPVGIDWHPQWDDRNVEHIELEW